mmetsp:Transcript_4943/g.31629  ORF Transcript_4943/g.31629 Transcript_4943/m.31629 type:complete len:560 (+) Transcript_4943:2479-4158(+)
MVWLAFVSFLLVPVPMALGRHRTWCWRTITQAWVRSDVGSRPSRVHCIGPFYQGSPDLPWEPERLEPTKRITVGPWTRPKATNTMVSDTSVEPTFNVFLDKMAHPNAVDLVRSIKSFLQWYNRNQPPVDLGSQKVQQFLQQMEASVRKHPLWREGKPEDVEAAMEGLEKYVMIKLYDLCFGVSADDKERDALLSAKIGALDFVKPSNLEIPPRHWDESSWVLAQKELQNVNQYKAPGDKLICVMNCCRVISNVLASSSSDQSPPGADEFFPLLVYTIIRANPPRLESNLQFVSRFRKADRLVSETAYFFTHFVSATSFLETLDATSLVGVDPAAFLRSMHRAGFPVSEDALVSAEDGGLEKLQAEEGQVEHSGTTKEDATPFSRLLPSVEELLCRGQHLVTVAEQNGTLSHYQYLYARPEDLRVGDVGPLLEVYKETVLQHECLCRAYQEMRDSHGQASQGKAWHPDQTGNEGHPHARAQPASGNVPGEVAWIDPHGEELADALSPLQVGFDRPQDQQHVQECKDSPRGTLSQTSETKTGSSGEGSPHGADEHHHASLI